MAAYRVTSVETDDFLSMMRTLASLSNAARLRGDLTSANIFSSVAGLLAEVHVARVPSAEGRLAEVDTWSAASPLA